MEEFKPGAYFENANVKFVRRVKEYRLLIADDRNHLEELTLSLENIGWITYGPPVVFIPTKENGLIRQVFTQPMVIYDKDILT